jgi:hypothetical protein
MQAAESQPKSSNTSAPIRLKENGRENSSRRTHADVLGFPALIAMTTGSRMTQTSRPPYGGDLQNDSARDSGQKRAGKNTHFRRVD